MEKGGVTIRHIQYGTDKVEHLDVDYEVGDSAVLANGNMQRVFHFKINPTQGPLPAWLTTREFDIEVEYRKTFAIVNFAGIPNVGNPDTAFLIAACYHDAARVVDWTGD